MSFLKYFIIISALTYLFTLVASVDPTKNCESSETSSIASKNEKQLYIVMVDKLDNKDSQLEWLKNCHNRTIVKSKESIRSAKKKNYVKDFSVDGLYGYTGWFSDHMATQLIKNQNGTVIVEKNGIMKINYVVPRTIQNKPGQNLDNIDQASVKPDGKFEFPDTAGQDVNIFIVDTGIRTTHNEFEGRAKFGGAFCDGCNDDDENGHGTQVASIAAGKTFGVSKKANLIAVRVLDANGSGSNVGVINGLAFVLDQHNKLKNKNTVVSMSLGGNKSEAVNDAVRKLTDAGAHVVVAAGNDALDACDSSPSSELSAITVGATETKSTNNKYNIAFFSNFGKCVDILAPGTDINGAGIRNDDDTKIFSGTSQATPHVSGTIALIIAKEGNKSPADMASALKDLSTKKIIDFSAVKGASNDSPNNFLRVPSP